jgi:zinc and cadmium transporter
MDSGWLLLIVSALIGSLFSLIGGVLLLVKKIDNKKIQLVALPFAAGALLAAAFGDLIPEAIEHSNAEYASLVVLIGFLFFFCLERFLGWFHHHHEHKSDAHRPTKILIIAGDAVHNLIDGIAMGAAFLADPVAGIVTTIAVAAHEIPKEMGDFGLLLGLGMGRRRVLLANLFSAGATVLGAAAVYGIGGSIVSIEPALLASTAGFFIYIAASDLIPTIHAETELKAANLQTAVLLAGTIAVFVAITSAHKLLH